MVKNAIMAKMCCKAECSVEPCCVRLYLSCCNEDLSILWGTQVVHDAHQLTCLGFGLLSLRHMQVHFITVKISVIGAANTFIEAESPAAAQVQIKYMLLQGEMPAGMMCISLDCPSYA